MAKPDLTQVPSFYHGYINHVQEDDILLAFRLQEPVIENFVAGIPPEKYDFKYSPGKWTIREVIQHMIDAERIFSYRALCFARNDSTPLPGFDENEYVNNSMATTRNWEDLRLEFLSVRKSSELLFKSFNEEQLMSKGIANNSSIIVLGIGFVIVGHVAHHIRILKERYLV